MLNFKAWLNTISSTSRSLPIVILYVTEGCNLHCITCSYRDPLPQELTLSEIGGLAERLHHFGLRHIVYSGGEPLLRRDFKQICEIFKGYHVKQTLLTNGLLLEKRFDELKDYFTEIIISLDGADAKTHNDIRGSESFEQILKGLRKMLAPTPRPKVSIRTVIQKQNYHQIMPIIEMARSLAVDRISFLAADVLSDGFGRDTRNRIVPNESLMLHEEETRSFRQIVEEIVVTYKPEFENGFIAESPEKMFHLVQYFEALTGQSAFPGNRCNAPDVSAVITSTGDLKPCFFLPAYGNIREVSLEKLVNSLEIKETRNNVRNYNLERCHTCVCTLKIQQSSLLFDKF